MQIDIRNQLEITRTDHVGYAERRLLFALSRFDNRLRVVRATLADVNGPRGGVDKVCRVRLTLWDASTLSVEANGTTIEVAIDCAAERVARLLARELERRRGFDRESPRRAF